MMATICSSALWGAANIYFVNGDLGENGLRGDPTYDFGKWGIQESAQMAELRQKGYFVHRLYGISPETFLRLLSDSETLGVFYNGHAQATEEEIARKQGHPSLLSGGSWTPFNAEAIALAKARLKLGGFNYRPSPSLQFVHLGFCYSTSCVSLFQSKLGIETPIVHWAETVSPNTVRADYRNGHGGNWFGRLPIAPASAKRMRGWENVAEYYHRTLTDDLLTLRIGNRSDYTLNELEEIQAHSFPTSAQREKILALARPKIREWNDVNALMEDSMHARPEEVETGRAARLKFLLDVGSRPEIRQRATVSQVRDTGKKSSLGDAGYLELLEKVGLPLVKSPEDFIELITIPAGSPKGLRLSMEQFAKDHRKDLEARLGASKTQRRVLTQMVNRQCHGRIRQLWDRILGR